MDFPGRTRLGCIVLHPGEHHISSRPVVLSTLLGSCVAVCLYDPVLGVMGMNHFLLASDRYPRKVPLLASAAGRYGVQAMELLINGLLKLGAQRGNLRAKAFGGGNVLQDWRDTGDAFLAIGDANIRFVREFLSTDRIPLVASDLGGCFGRQVHFDGSDYSVYVRKIETAPSRQVVEQERIYLRQDLERHQREAGHQQVEYW